MGETSLGVSTSSAQPSRREVLEIEIVLTSYRGSPNSRWAVGSETFFLVCSIILFFH